MSQQRQQRQRSQQQRQRSRKKQAQAKRSGQHGTASREKERPENVTQIEEEASGVVTVDQQLCRSGTEVTDEEDSGPAGRSYSRRAVESNWDKYEEDKLSDAVSEEELSQRLTLLLQAPTLPHHPLAHPDPYITSTQESGAQLTINFKSLAIGLSKLPLHQRLDVDSTLLDQAVPYGVPPAIAATLTQTHTSVQPGTTTSSSTAHLVERTDSIQQQVCSLSQHSQQHGDQQPVLASSVQQEEEEERQDSSSGSNHELDEMLDELLN